MEVKAVAKYIRISPRKVRLVASLVRGKHLDEALNQLNFVGKKAAAPVKKAIMSAAANAKHNFDLAENNLFIKEIRIDQGPVLSRWLPRAHGRATPLRKRMSHINITLAEITESGKKAARKVAADAPIKLGSAPKEDEGVKVDAKTDAKPKDHVEAQEKKDVSREGRHGHSKIEGGAKGFTSKIFHRKSG